MANIVIFDDDIKIDGAKSVSLKPSDYVNLVDILKDCDVIITKDLSLRRDMLDILTKLKKVFTKKGHQGLRVDFQYLDILQIKYFEYEKIDDILSNI